MALAKEKTVREAPEMRHFPWSQQGAACTFEHCRANEWMRAKGDAILDC